MARVHPDDDLSPVPPLRRLPEPLPVEVLHDGAWTVGELLAWRPTDGGLWRGYVRYSIDSERGRVGYEHWRPSTELRRAPEPG